MQRALQLAKQAETQQEVPVGALLVKGDDCLGEGFNQPIARCDPTAHAEIMALRSAAHSQQNYRLADTTLYVTLEPCAMCLGAIIQARVQRIVFAADDFRAGALRSVFQLAEEPKLNHRVTWEGGLLAEESAKLLKAFFQARRA